MISLTARSIVYLTAASLALVAAPAEIVVAASFHGLGVIGNGSSYGDSVSGDGRVVGGHGTGGVFRWSEAGGKQFVETPSDYYFNLAAGLSYDGGTVVGWADDESKTEWTPAFQRIGSPVVSLREFMRPDTEDSVAATDVTADGQTILGWGYSTTRQSESFFYDDVHGLRYISDLTGDTRPMLAQAISADGSVVTGYIVTELASWPYEIVEAFLYDAEHGIRGLGGLDGMPAGSWAKDISADGSTVVGWAESASGQQAFLYQDDIGMKALGMLPSRWPTTSEATAVSGDGSIVVGRSETQAFIYDAVNGMRPLRDYLMDLGLDLSGWWLDSATAISDDGLTIVGRGLNPSGDDEGWVVVIPEPSTAVLLLIGIGWLAGSKIGMAH